jgi:non-specific protein-tyrosine kinase
VLHERLGCPNDPGLVDWLASPGESIPICPTEDGPSLLPGGPASADPAAILTSQQWPMLLAALDQQADIVIIAGPPILPAAEIALLAPQVDGILIVLRAGKSKLSKAGEALEALDLVDGPILGLAVNKG